MQPFNSEKTATEISSLETTRSIRDNFNQIFLSEAIKQQMYFWVTMNQQFLFSDPSRDTYTLRIVGRAALNEFKALGLAETQVDTSSYQMETAMDDAMMGGTGEMPETPMYPVSVNGEVKPKLEEGVGDVASLYVVPDDMVGTYDLIIDVEPMRANQSGQEKQVKLDTFQTLTNPTVLQLLMQQGKMLNIEELIVDTLDAMGSKGADRYFGGMKGIYGQTAATQAGGTQAMSGGGTFGGTPASTGMGNPQGMAPQQM